MAATQAVLRELHIRDLAVVEAVDLEFGDGFTALTGETGAGKSILVDALALALGERADTQAIRAGAARLEVTASFDLAADAPARTWLAEAELDDGTDCSLRRVVGSDGRSRAWINGRPVPIQTLRELGEMLVDICGQQDYQSLRHRTVQRAMLDGLGGNQELLAGVRTAYEEWRRLEVARQDLHRAGRDREARAELLRFQVEELAALAPRAGEFAALEQEHRLHQHRTRIAEGLSLALARIYDDEGSAQDALGKARRALEDLVDVDSQLEAALKLLAEADIHVREAADLLRHRADQNDDDPAREAEVAERLNAMQELGRKHRIAPGELASLFERLRDELAELGDAGRSATELDRLAGESRAQLEKLAARLTGRRQKAAAELAKSVTRNMTELGMATGRFEVRVEPAGRDGIGPDGADEVEFLVSANPGQPPGPLARVASGGELSRLNLAIQVVATASAGAPTLIFDEVDAGVGGAVAEIVGRQLRALSRTRQVLCITHLPQVATLAGHQATVQKTNDGKTTATTVRQLTPAERVEEIARMLGGVKITQRTRAHAREMLEAGRSP